jgi:hypothetical protein
MVVKKKQLLLNNDIFNFQYTKIKIIFIKYESIINYALSLKFDIIKVIFFNIKLIIGNFTLTCTTFLYKCGFLILFKNLSEISF